MNHNQGQSQQPPPQFVAVPWMTPPAQMQQVSTVYHPENVVPARIDMAAGFAFAMARRASPIVVSNEVGIQVEDAPELTISEHKAWAAACDLLTQYFNGSVDPDDTEELRFDAINTEIDRRRCGQTMACSCRRPNEQGVFTKNPDKDCDMCRGCGTVIIMPAIGAID
jgi:hypothetical protein